MTHADAMKDELVERYLLGELAEDQMQEFEAHYFECPTCADDVRLAAVFHETTKAVLGQPEHQANPASKPRAKHRRSLFQDWWAWAGAQPAWAVAAILFCTTTWQAFFLIPDLKRQAALARAPRSVVAAVLRAETRGAPVMLTLPRAEPALLLVFDINGPDSAQTYVAELETTQGKSVFAQHVKAPPAGSSLHLLVPALTLPAGQYILTIRDEHTNDTREPIGSYRFTLERP